MIGLLFFLLLLFNGVAQAQVVGPTLAPARIVEPMEVPNGGPPQVVGYSAANTPESETVIGDVTFTRTGASQYTAQVVGVSGITVGRLAVLNVGTGLEEGAGDTLNLTVPVAITSGGTGGTTAPTAGQILIAQSATAYAPMPFAGDATIGTNGQVTVTRLNGMLPGGQCGANQFVDVISASGVPTCATPQIVGVPNGSPNQLVGYSAVNTGESQTISGGPGNCTVTRTGPNAATMTCGGYATTASPTFTGTVNMPAGGWTSAGLLAVPAGSFFGNVTSGGTVTGANFNLSSGTGAYAAAAGATYQQPGWTGTFPTNAVWDENGLQNMQGLGIGTTVGADPIDIIRNQNAVTAITITNLNAGGGAQAVVRAVNGPTVMGLGITGTGASSLPNSGFISSTQGIAYITGNNQPHQFYVGTTVMASIGSAGLQLPTPLGVGNGGVGTGAVPLQNQVLIAQSATAYAPQTISGDLTLASTGVATAGTSGTYQPVLYAGSTTPCGITYSNTNGQVGYYYKVGKQVTVYFVISLSSLGTCANLPVYVSVPFAPSYGVSTFIAGYDLVQISPFNYGGSVAAGSTLIAQSAGVALGTGAILLGGLLNGNGAAATMANLSNNSTIRGRTIYLTD